MSEQSWSALTRSEVTRVGEHMARAALEHAGYSVVEANDRGVTDLIASRSGRRTEVTVRALRSLTYTFVEKHRFDLREDRAVALVLLLDGQPPQVFLIPARAWRSPNGILVDRDYADAESRPEWGISLSGRNLPLLGEYALEAGR